MGIFDAYNDYFNPFNNGSGKAADDTRQGYDKANQYMAPYQQQGAQQWGNLNNWTNQQGQMLAQQGNPMQWAWAHANESPNQFTNDIMSGYQQSPQAKYAMQNMQNAAQNGASASGMLGSGAFYKGLNENANQIGQADQQQYFNNAMQSYGGQMAAGQNFQDQQSQYANMMARMAQMGMNAGQNMGQNDEGSAYYKGQGDMANQQMIQNDCFPLPLYGRGLNYVLRITRSAAKFLANLQ